MTEDDVNEAVMFFSARLGSARSNAQINSHILLSSRNHLVRNVRNGIG